MDARVEDVGRVGEDRLGAVAVVDVPVEDQHPLGAAAVERVRGGDRDVVEQAEAHRPVGARRGGPGGRRAQKAACASPASSRSAAAAAPPAACSAASKESRARRSCRCRSSRRPRAAERLDRVDVLGGVDAQRAARGSPPAPRPARARASRSRSSAASIAAQPAGVLGMAPVSWRCEDGCVRVERHRDAGVPYPARGRRPEHADDRRWSAAAPPGCTSRSRPPSAGARTTLVSRKPLAESSSFWAQGGLAAALAADDSPERHAADTLAAGRGLCRTSAVEVLTREAPGGGRAAARAAGSASTPSPDGELALGLEGGHSARRIVHAGGSETGRAITSRLAELVAAEDADRGARGRLGAIALWSDGERCAGVLTDARRDRRARRPCWPPAAARRCGARTTNPWGAIGAGAVLAHAAGAELADLELCQFHPTALALPGARARRRPDHRGGPRRGRDAARRRRAAVHRRARPARPGHRRDPRPDGRRRLRPRAGSTCAALDPTRFPNVFAICREAGLDPEREPVPVAPAAHYLIGGIAADLDGRTSLPGLLAVGECACTRPARRQPARLELAQRVLRLRQPRRARRARRAADRGPPPPAPEWRFEPPTDATREAVWRHAGPAPRRGRARAAARATPIRSRG